MGKARIRLQAFSGWSWLAVMAACSSTATPSGGGSGDDGGYLKLLKTVSAQGTVSVTQTQTGYGETWVTSSSVLTVGPGTHSPVGDGILSYNGLSSYAFEFHAAVAFSQGATIGTESTSLYSNQISLPPEDPVDANLNVGVTFEKEETDLESTVVIPSVRTVQTVVTPISNAVWTARATDILSGNFTVTIKGDYEDVTPTGSVQETVHHSVDVILTGQVVE